MQGRKLGAVQWEGASEMQDVQSEPRKSHISHFSSGILLRTSSFFPIPIPIATPTAKCIEGKPGIEVGIGICCVRIVIFDLWLAIVLTSEAWQDIAPVDDPVEDGGGAWGDEMTRIMKNPEGVTGFSQISLYFRLKPEIMYFGRCLQDLFSDFSAAPPGLFFLWFGSLTQGSGSVPLGLAVDLGYYLSRLRRRPGSAA